jgi:enoyl-CoA hydratase/carnithine racemase
MTDDLVLSEHRVPGVALVTLNRPEQLNAWTGALGVAYFDALQAAADDPAIRAIVVTGAGRGFCAGADLGGLQEMGAGSAPKPGGSGETPQHVTITVPKPVIAAINGPCAGIGLVQALMCDVRFAAAGAKFTTAFSRRGLIAEYGISWLLPRLVGTSRALDLLFSGRTFLAEEAAEIGLVSKVLPGDVLVDHALAYAADLAANVSPTSMAVMKQQVYRDQTRGLVEAHDDAVALMRASIDRPDFREGVASFLDKRPPRFAPLG